MATGYNPYYQAGYYNPYQAVMPPVTPTVPPYTPPPYSAQGQPAPVQAVQQPAPAPAPQAMTPPTVHVDIIQVKNADEIDRFPVNAGTSQLFQFADDSAFVIKSVFPNGQSDTDIYVKQPKKPVQPALDPSVYVTREELEKRLAGLTRFRSADTEGAENGESV